MEQESVIKAFLFECLERKKYGHILDLGCGDGTYTKFIQDHIDPEVAGVEQDPDAIQKSKARGVFIRDASLITYIDELSAVHKLSASIVKTHSPDIDDIIPLYKQSFTLLNVLPYLGKYDVINTIKNMQEMGSTILIVSPYGIMESKNSHGIILSSWDTHELEQKDFKTFIVEDFYPLGQEAIFAFWSTSEASLRGWYSFRQLLKQKTWG